MPTIETTTGPLDVASVGLALPHEHLFVDFLHPADPAYGRVDRAAVREACVARLSELRRLGVDLLVDCTPIGIGRDVALLRDVSLATGVRIVAATGIYKGLVPPSLAGLPPDRLAGMFVRELVEGIEGTGVRAGIIKLAVTDAGATPVETAVHRAGAMAAVATGATIVLHSPRAAVARQVLATLETEGFAPSHLVWAHAQDATLDDNLELAARGVTISLDAIGVSHDEDMLDRIRRLTEAGHGSRILVSTDTSIRVNPPELAYPRSIEHLRGPFLDLVRIRFGDPAVTRLTQANVTRAVARRAVT